MKKIICLVFSVIVFEFLFLNLTFAGEKAYIANRNAGNVSVIDIDSAQVVKTITVGFQPTSVAASEDGSRVFILNEGDKTISVINPSSDTVIDTLDISFTWPEDSPFGPMDFKPSEIVASPSGDVVYVASMGFGILVVDIASGKLIEIHSTLGLSNFIVGGIIDISPAGDFFYAGKVPGVLKFDATTLKLVGTFEMLPMGIVVTEDGETIYATGIDPDFLVVDTKSFIIDDFSLDGIFFSTGLGFDFPNPVTVSPDGKIIYFICESITNITNSPIYDDGPAIVSVDMINRKFLEAIPAGTSSTGIDITSDGKKLVIPNTGDNTVSIIDAETLQVLSTVAVGPTPMASKRFIARVPGSGGGPKPDIKVNGSDGPVAINTSSNISVTVELDSGDKVGEDADWWVAESTPDGWYYYNLISWVNIGSSPASLSPTYQGALFDLSSYSVLNTSGLSEGTYTFYFAIDTNANGSLDMDKLYFDSVSVSVSGTSNFKLTDTGQTGSYTDTFGEDSDYTNNPPSYTDNGDGTVTDNNTALMWQQDDDNTRYNWYEASGTADTVYNEGAAINYCGSLTLAGHADWRLPDYYELQDIINLDNFMPATDTTYFPTKSEYYWSSSSMGLSSLMSSPTDTTTNQETVSTLAWLVDFRFGNIGAGDKYRNKFVRCVRGEQRTRTVDMTDNGNGTVTDNMTGLMWQQEDDDITRNWEDSITYCEGFSLAGHADWRLPNIKELASIIDLTPYTYALDEEYFPNWNTNLFNLNYNYWSSTTVTYGPDVAWYAGFFLGGVQNQMKSSDQYVVRCVRGGTSQ